MRTPLRSLGTVALLVALSMSCSSSDDDAAPATEPTAAAEATTAPTATSTPPAPTPTTAPTSASTPEPAAAPSDAELEAAVLDFWDVYLELGAVTDPFDPIATRARLEQRTSGDELQTLFNFFQSNALAGYVIRGEIESSLTVVSASDDSAEVRDCYDDTTGLYRIDTGERVDTDNPERHQVVFVLINDAGAWKVDQVRDEGDGCVASG